MCTARRSRAGFASTATAMRCWFCEHRWSAGPLGPASRADLKVRPSINYLLAVYLPHPAGDPIVARGDVGVARVDRGERDDRGHAVLLPNPVRRIDGCGGDAGLGR